MFYAKSDEPTGQSGREKAGEGEIRRGKSCCCPLSMAVHEIILMSCQLEQSAVAAAHQIDQQQCGAGAETNKYLSSYNCLSLSPCSLPLPVAVSLSLREYQAHLLPACLCLGPLASGINKLRASPPPTASLETAALVSESCQRVYRVYEAVAPAKN